MAALGRYIRHHWQGEHSLARSYWLNTFLSSLLLFILVRLLGLIDAWAPLAVVATLILAFELLLLPFALWAYTGLWRSARRRIAARERVFWPYIACFLVVVGWIQMVWLPPQILEYARIASGNDPFGRITMTLLDDQRSASLSGGIGEGSSTIFTRFIAEHPQVSTIVLDSRGGRVYEVEQIAALVRGRKLSTYVEGQCLSGCAQIFLAGADRGATPAARLGFHQRSFPGRPWWQNGSSMAEQEQQLREDGVPEAFARKVLATPAADMWYPTHDELRRAGIITRTSLGGESRLLGTALASRESIRQGFLEHAIFRRYEERYPGLIERAVDAVWAARQAGLADNEMMAAARAVFQAKETDLILRSMPSIRRDYHELVIDQLKAARAISNNACLGLLGGQAMPTQLLPESLVEREFTLVERAFAVDPSPPPQASEADLRRFTAPALAQLPSEEQRALATIGSGRTLHVALCDALIHFHELILALPAAERDAVIVDKLRGLQ